jgi:hypothetical protein
MITYLVEFPIFCDVNTSRTDTVSKYVNKLLNVTSRSTNQMQLRYEVKTVCVSNNVDMDVTNISDFIGKTFKVRCVYFKNRYSLCVFQNPL